MSYYLKQKAKEKNFFKGQSMECIFLCCTFKILNYMAYGLLYMPP